MSRTPARRILLVVALVLSGLALHASPAAAAPLAYTVDLSDSATLNHLMSLDLATGAATDIGNTGLRDVEGLSLDCAGVLWGVNRGVGSGNLVRINTTTGAATVVGPLGVEGADAGLTFGTDGRLWMAEVITGNFFRVNTTTGAATVVGPLGAGIEITALATAPNGTIFGFDRRADRLVTINTTTGAATVLGTTGLALNLGGLDFDASGTLWGVFGRGPRITARFNTSTGAGTQVASTSPREFVSLAMANICAVPPTLNT